MPACFSDRIRHASETMLVTPSFAQGAVVPEVLLRNIDVMAITTTASQFQYVSTVQIKSGSITFYCVDNTDTTQQLIQDLCNAIAMMCNLFLYRAPFTMIYLLVDLPKVYGTGIIGQRKYINSGYTDTDLNQIVIFRQQEVLKVSIHELVHLFHQDDEALNFVPLNRFVAGASMYSPREGYTEFMARTIYTLYTGGDLQRQFHYTLKQCAKILHFDHWTAWNHDVKIQQETYAFEYYVISAALMWSAAQAPFDPTKTSILEIESRINATFRDKHFINTIDVLLACNVFDTDLRMTY